MQAYQYAGIIPNNIDDYAESSSLPYGYCGSPLSENAPNSSDITASYYQTSECTKKFLNETSLAADFESMCEG
jgi:hypothetical protein